MCHIKTMQHSGFSKVIIRVRFRLLETLLHFTDNADSSYDLNDDKRNRCHQVYPFTKMERN